MKEEILTAIESIRPFLQADSGDIEFIDYSEDDGILRIRFTGACAVCPLSQMTLRAGIERSLLRQLPGIRRVEAVQDN
ncbi:MAG: NifU family protein [Ignavibacteriaceae bacterium]